MRIRLTLVLMASYLLAGCMTPTSMDKPVVSNEGLRAIAGSEFKQLYIRPDTDFSQFAGIYVQDLQIEFERGWENSQNITDPHRVTDKDIALIREQLSREFRDSFVSAFAKSAGLRIVAKAGEHTLVMDPAILNFNINNPDNHQPYPTITLAEISASMTIALNLRDSASGALLLGLSDRGRTRDYLRYSQQETVKNQTDISKLLNDWGIALGRVLQSEQPGK